LQTPFFHQNLAKIKGQNTSKTLFTHKTGLGFEHPPTQFYELLIKLGEGFSKMAMSKKRLQTPFFT
jgi:hypothetical protein